MSVLRVVLLILLVAFTAEAQQNSPEQPVVPPASCPVTTPPAISFIPRPPYEPAGEKTFYLGSEKLWTVVMKSGVWYWGPHARGHENEVQPLTEKTFWVSSDFNWKTEYPPALRVSGRRLDGVAPPLLTLRPTNAFPGPSAAMLVGVYVPTPGCWAITGEYKGQKLSFVVWLQAVKSH